MQISQWTTEIIVISVIIAVACCVIGYFVAALRHGNRLGQLTSQLGQAQQAQGLLTQQLAQAQEQLKAAGTTMLWAAGGGRQGADPARGCQRAAARVGDAIERT